MIHRGSRLLAWYRRLPAWVRILGLAALVHGVVLHPILTSLVFEIDMLHQPDDFGPDDFPLSPGTPLETSEAGLDLGSLSALCLVMLMTTFGVGAIVVTLRRRQPDDPPT